MFSRSNNTTVTASKYQFTMLLVAITLLWCQCCSAGRLSTFVRSSERLNPNLRCPGKNEENIWHSCKHGGYIVENPDRNNCGDRYECYVGLNEPCSHRDRCADNAICTVCGICQKCDSAENCSDFELCPNFYGFQAMNSDLIKRLMQKRLVKINSGQF